MKACCVLVLLTLSVPVGARGERSEKRALLDRIVEVGERHLIERLGEEFVGAYVSLKSSSYKVGMPYCKTCSEMRKRPHYDLAFRADMPENPYARLLFLLSISVDGSLVESNPRTIAPNCVEHPEDCLFSIDRDTAMNLAKSAGLAEGVRPWSVNFRYSTSYGRWAWHIHSMIRDYPHGEGRVAVIDANTGDCLGFLTTETIYD